MNPSGPGETWRRILEDTARAAALSPVQRFWRVLALLRTGGVDEAERCLAAGSAEWRAGVRARLLDAELALARREPARCARALEEAFPLLPAAGPERTSWQHLVGRCRPATARLAALLARLREAGAPAPAFAFASAAEWRRAAGLAEHAADAAFHLAWLEWLRENGGEGGELDAAACAALAASRGAADRHRLYRAMRRAGRWTFLVEHLLAAATRGAADPLALWERWHADCPRAHRQDLRGRMRAILARSPDAAREAFLDSLDGRT